MDCNLTRTGFAERVEYVALLMLEAIATAPVRRGSTFREHIRTLFGIETRTFDRVSAAAALPDWIVPKASESISRFLCSFGKLPLAYQDLRLFSWGSESSVFLVKGMERPLVLKVCRFSFGRTMTELHALAKRRQARHTAMCDWYNHADFQFILPTHFLVLSGPLLGRPAVATVQPYVDGEKQDFLHDLPDEGMVCKLRENARLRNEFAWFIQRTEALCEDSVLGFDLLGPKNLMLVSGDRGCGLMCTDPGPVDLSFMKARQAGKYLRYRGHLERLRRILDRSRRCTPEPSD